jgi:prevent-host-death family protein
MNEEIVNVAEAEKHFSELLGQVAYGKKQILITKRGKQMARLVPAGQNERHLGRARGWLSKNDPFFETVDRIVRERSEHTLRALRQTDGD